VVIADLVDETIDLLRDMAKSGTEEISCVFPLAEEIDADTPHERVRQ
jgi:hypothetical protein